MATKKINLETLIESYMEASTSDALALDEALKEYGYDPLKIETTGVQKIRQLFFQHQVASKKKVMMDLYAKAISLVQVAAVDSKEAIFCLLQQRSPSLQFRNLEKLDEENLRQILNETEILDLIDKLEKTDQQ